MAGTLYVADVTRTLVPAGLVKALNLDVKISKADATFEANFPLKKFPSYLGENGFKLTETIAISVYFAKLGAPELLGKNDEEFAQILKWASFANSDIMTSVTDSFAGIVGKVPYNKKTIETGRAKLTQYAQLLEDRLYNFTYLVGERITLADLIVAQSHYRVFSHVFGKEDQAKYPNLVKYFKTITNSKYLQSEFAGYKFTEKPVEYVPPKKEKKAAAPAAKKEQKPKAAAAEAAPAEAAPAPKPKHPLEELPRISLEDWKRVYSNEDTRKTAIPYFWKEVYNPNDWSLWQVDYKYNDELTLTFMSNNLTGGFMNRLSASNKYLFGCLVVYGENNNNGITGFFMVRGQEHEPAFNVAPDWESYSFKKLDGSDEKVVSFVNNMLAWDEPVEINGEKREIADGKVFK